MTSFRIMFPFNGEWNEVFGHCCSLSKEARQSILDALKDF